ncbi:MAG: hypothetical protein ACK5TK_16655 [Betaproteobacteria bacterium]
MPAWSGSGVTQALRDVAQRRHLERAAQVGAVGQVGARAQAEVEAGRVVVDAQFRLRGTPSASWVKSV